MPAQTESMWRIPLNGTTKEPGNTSSPVNLLCLPLSPPRSIKLCSCFTSNAITATSSPPLSQWAAKVAYTYASITITYSGVVCSHVTKLQYCDHESALVCRSIAALWLLNKWKKCDNSSTITVLILQYGTFVVTGSVVTMRFYTVYLFGNVR